jgi:RNA polymerase sigma-70 factor, ECF subfamily
MDSTTSSQREREQRFWEIYDSVYVDLLRFVRRRVHPTHAEDVVGDVMLVAWRRLDEVPAELSAARAWLFGVARKTLQNTRRRDSRHNAVAVRLADVRHGPADAGQHPDLVAHRVDIAAAWPLLSALHQEAIALSVLDGLTAPEAGAVLGISSTAFRLRLSRARRSLRRHVDYSTTAGDRVPGHLASDRSPR